MTGENGRDRDVEHELRNRSEAEDCEEKIWERLRRRDGRG